MTGELMRDPATAAHVARLIAAAPPLTAQQRERVAAIFAAARPAHPRPARRRRRAA